MVDEYISSVSGEKLTSGEIHCFQNDLFCVELDIKP